MNTINPALILASTLCISIFENRRLEPPARITYVSVLVVFEEDISFELSAANVHATVGVAKG